MACVKFCPALSTHYHKRRFTLLLLLLINITVQLQYECTVINITVQI